jgi:hypothetical protein
VIKDFNVSFPGRLILCHPVDEEGMLSGIKAFVERYTPPGWTPP